MDELYSRNKTKKIISIIFRHLYHFINVIKHGSIFKIFIFELSPKFIRKYLFYRFNLEKAPSSYKLSSDLTSLEVEALKALCFNGVVKLPFSLKEDIKRLQYQQISFDLGVHKSLELDDPLVRIIRDNKLLKNLGNKYYAGNFFIRENPTLHINTYKDYLGNPPPSDIYHADGFRQLSLMLLLHDLTVDDIYMKYALGSHINMQPTYDRSLLKQELVEKKFQILNVIGEIGDMFLFDTEGLHKGFYNKFGKRAMIHWNFHCGIYENKVPF
jgi:hypothetical protein